MIALSASNSCAKLLQCHEWRLQLTSRRVGNAISANLEDTTNLPVNKEALDLVKKSGWIGEEYEHLWRRDGGGSAALTSHGILSK